MSDNPFIRTKDNYIRRLDLIDYAVDDATHFLHVSTGRDEESCRAYVQRSIQSDGLFPIQAKQIRCTKRLENGDRIKHVMGFDELLGYVKRTNSILSPNMVVYDNPDVNLSFLAKFIDDKMALRSVVKKRGQKAKMEGNKQLQVFCDNMQTTIKTLINSLSGAHASPHNPHYNKTAHSTLTSATRIATSYANASTERLLAGNRHYWNSEVTLNNIISITRNMDYVEVQKIMNKYNLYIPSADNVMWVVETNTKMYWNDPTAMDEIRAFVHRLNPLQRAVFVYCGDMYHMAQFNGDFIRGIITEIITRPDYVVDNPDEHVGKSNGDIIALCGILCSDLLAGMQVSKLKETRYDDYLTYASTIAHVNSVFAKYYDLIYLFLTSDNMPPCIYHFPGSIRKVVVGSDTDSVMFTCQQWVEWYHGSLRMDIEGQRISATLMYFNAQVVAHMLAMISRQLGVVDKNLFRLQMKNEYSFLVYMVANRAKHYVTMINAKEGNIYKEPEIDIKGVGLKDSKVPPRIMGTLEALIKQNMHDIMAGRTIDIYPVMQRIANIEHEISASIKSGKIEYLSRAYIKSKLAYKDPTISNYVHYDMWKNVFSLRYGEMSEPPYPCVKISNTLDTAKRFSEWVDTLDPMLRDAMRDWQKVTGKEAVGQFILPVEKVLTGVPEEFIRATNIRGITSELMQGFYIYLEILGIYMRNNNTTRLLSDEIKYIPESGSFLID